MRPKFDDDMPCFRGHVQAALGGILSEMHVKTGGSRSSSTATRNSASGSAATDPCTVRRRARVQELLPQRAAFDGVERDHYER